MKTLILGLGNEILGDDAFGIEVARRLKVSGNIKKADIVECSASGFRLLDYLEGYDRAFIIDSYLSEEKPAGNVIVLDIADDPGPPPGSSSHFFSFPQSIRAGRMMGMHLPGRITAFCVTIKEYNFTDRGISPELEPAAMEIFNRIIDALG